MIRAKYCIWSVDEKIIKDAKALVLRYGDPVIEINQPIDLTLKFLYQMLNLSTKDKSKTFLNYRSSNPEEFEEGACDQDRAQMIRILGLPKVYELATGHKGGELIECSFEVADIRAVDQVESLVAKANTTAYQGGGRNVAYSDFEVPAMRGSVYSTPLSKLRRNTYNEL